ncbi:hypothetical protein HBI56_047620 [Parastagonospora nodorum]|uniref:Heterokaryon incompatibility domain-containing protein n=1 Tax=Phaeosphaeria nodorum (strain SN15 / ATCC MYA-4574 / FGSC 10173) TaxID=321614 RepID=A0A7U2ES89_PHANO|nr:hypothetical protein HBH56_060560 [Parastagonospora nodorum]QRC91896.1 hypothetical protein JI435_301380 [Parastagonospora nodorum SN15]KAH3931045.1 hypothetical protein HBH54_104490 [Parastagonospora nodorum]KAH3968206.1 hypothetical protein HBH51_134310 [Parastagonospora nodorum]KAH4074136.1 hypothetical protein HBH50_043010 [Parastagonospora nodorum]
MGDDNHRIGSTESKCRAWVEQFRRKLRWPAILPFFKAEVPARCSTCSLVDFHHLWGPNGLEEAFLPNQKPYSGGRYFRLQRSDNCDLCAILMPGYELGEFASLGVDFGLLWKPFLGEEAVCLSFQLEVGREAVDRQVSMGKVFFYAPLRYYESAPGFLKPKFIGDTPDYDECRAWLENCQTHHGPDCNRPTPLIDGLHLFDCQRAKVVRADSIVNPHWVALSYVWGDRGHADAAEVSHDHHAPRLPQTIMDAVKVTQELGYRYLWIDELCIDQNNAAHENSQLGKMDQIYRGAEFTIVAAAGRDKTYGLPGVSTTKRVQSPVLRFDQGLIFSIGPEPNELVAEATVWSTRGWTFQEGFLSKRLLVFTDWQVTFYCQKASWMEALGGPRFMRRQDIDWDQWPNQASLWNRDQDWHSNSGVLSALHGSIRLLENYTCRHLSYESDAVKAVSGILSYQREASKPMFHLSGLPYYPPSAHGTSSEATQRPEEVLALTLSWRNLNRAIQTKRRYMFPSWTWAGWSGPVVWVCHYASFTRGIPTSVKTHIRSARMLNAAGQDIEYRSSARNLQEALDSVTVLVLEALAIPPDLFRSKGLLEEGAGQSLEDIIIAGVELSKSLIAPDTLVSSILANVHAGVWSCFVLASQGSLHRFVLVVEWENDDTATRVGGFVFFQDVTHMSGDEAQEAVRAFDSLLEFRTVQLV